jgi:hypothetical protein
MNVIERGFREAPIVGEDGCVRFGIDRHAELPIDGRFMSAPFTLLLDLQPDVLTEQTVLGAREQGGSSLVLTSNVDDKLGRLRVEVADSQGRMLLADVLAGPTLGKRLLISVRPTENEVAAAELQPWASADALQVEYLRRDGPREFPEFSHPVVLSGVNVSGVRQGAFRGRMAHFAMFERVLEPTSVSRLRETSATRASSDVPTLRPGALDDEGRETFREDWGKLRRWLDQGQLTRGDTRDAAAIAHMWLCDRKPLLGRFADHYGLQVSLPDLHPLRAYSELARESNPVFMYHADHWEGNWLAPSNFLNDMAFWLAGHREVSWVAFIKFVRNKVGGGGHFDPEDRKRWQQQLNTMIRESSVGGQEWMNVKMLALVRALVFTAESCGLVALAGE